MWRHEHFQGIVLSRIPTEANVATLRASVAVSMPCTSRVKKMAAAISIRTCFHIFA